MSATRKRRADTITRSQSKRPKPLERYHPVVERVRQLTHELTGSSYAPEKIECIQKHLDAAFLVAVNKRFPDPPETPLLDVEAWLLAGKICQVEPSPGQVRAFLDKFDLARFGEPEGPLNKDVVTECFNLTPWLENNIVWTPATSVVCDSECCWYAGNPDREGEFKQYGKFRDVEGVVESPEWCDVCQPWAEDSFDEYVEDFWNALMERWEITS